MPNKFDVCRSPNATDDRDQDLALPGGRVAGRWELIFGSGTDISGVMAAI
jgi:hypothetical protein